MLLAALIAAICGGHHPTPAFSTNPAVCDRTPQVRQAIMEPLNHDGCETVTPNDLRRIESLEVHNIAHPGDLAGLANLRTLQHRGNPDHLDLTRTPELRRLTLTGITRWPEAFAIPDLPRLEHLEIHVSGAAACRMYHQDTTRQLLGNLLYRLEEIRFRLYIRLPYNGQHGDQPSARDEETRITAVMIHSLEALDEGWTSPEPAYSHAIEPPVNVQFDSAAPPCQS